MFSVPPARTIFLSPKRICWAPVITAFMPLAHTLLIKVVGVETLHPAPSITCLSGAYPNPAELTHPKNDSSTSVGNIPAYSMAPLAAVEPKIGASRFAI